jgi:epoxyqueuosine reductase
LGVPGVRREQGRLRKELGLTSPVPLRAVELARQAGFHRVGIVNPRLLEPWAARISESPGVATDRSSLDWGWVTHPQGWSTTATVLVCCLSCRRLESDDPSSPGNPHALIAPFARAHYYREAVHRLRAVARRLQQDTDIPASNVRLFSNSRLPEKPLLAAAGLAALGRNGCAIAPGLGSLFIIAGAVIPVPTPPEAADVQPLPDPCGSCRRCRAACPTRALDQPWVVRRDRCLQAAATRAGRLSRRTMEQWGVRLYGCQECQACCPHNAGLDSIAPPATGEVGPGIPLRAFLAEDERARAERVRGSALGLSWMPPEALLRNALVAAGNRGDPSLRPLIEGYQHSPSGGVRAAARWALGRLPAKGPQTERATGGWSR